MITVYLHDYLQYFYMIMTSSSHLYLTGKEKAAIIKAIRHISSLKDEEMVFKAIKIAVYFLKKEYNSIHDKVTGKGH